ncbi:hypothetical protein TELCIR_20420 [Teladorsagia circumcincta]|uniref:Cystatin domain-containing protein n=1 Tax=Teladorsagia circumcincta TaxID=45464 RepID=A0A2G9TJK7_TELCI|nr:hypothetical protein TELCIR_20420 [Teladorsagia circumcincta]
MKAVVNFSQLYPFEDTSAAELSAANCKPKEDGKRAIYEVELWEKPWENFEQFNVKKVKTLAAGEQV